jgi:mRNA interferase MazF
VIAQGQIVLFRFPQTDLQLGKLRPALVLRKLPGCNEDWLICMISTQLGQEIIDFDETISPQDSDFKRSGLKRKESQAQSDVRKHYLRYGMGFR